MAIGYVDSMTSEAGRGPVGGDSAAASASTSLRQRNTKCLVGIRFRDFVVAKEI